jgi:hypothetical protein
VQHSLVVEQMEPLVLHGTPQMPFWQASPEQHSLDDEQLKPLFLQGVAQ